MKKLPKKKLDEIIELSRLYWQTEYEEEFSRSVLRSRIILAQQLEAETGVMWDSVVGLLDALLRSKGFLPNAENYEIYIVLGVLGWEVTDEIQESESL